MELLENALARRIPGPVRWVRQTGDPRPYRDREYWYEIRSDRHEAQRLVILLRSDGDVQVEYHVDKPGSPFEALFMVEDGHGAVALEQVAEFVADLLEERAALGYIRGWFRGGRTFLKPDELSEPGTRRLRWVTSWRGTYDWP